MKLSFAVVIAFAASVAAVPIRVITLTGEPLDNLHALDNLPPKDVHWDALTGPPHHPCNKLKGYPSGPIGALLSRLGLTSPGKDQSTYPEWSAKSSLDDISEAIHGHLREMLHAAESKVVPLMEGVVVRIPSVMDNPSEAQPKHQQTLTWESLEGKEGVKHHHHHGHQTQMALSFGGRLHRALHNLTPAESITMAFVLGTGIGSILHFIFMICLISMRHFRCGGKNRAGRKAARKARRMARREDRVRLDGDETVEEPPKYQEGEALEVVEKA